MPAGLYPLSINLLRNVSQLSWKSLFDERMRRRRNICIYVYMCIFFVPYDRHRNFLDKALSGYRIELECVELKQQELFKDLPS